MQNLVEHISWLCSRSSQVNNKCMRWACRRVVQARKVDYRVRVDRCSLAGASMDTWAGSHVFSTALSMVGSRLRITLTIVVEIMTIDTILKGPAEIDANLFAFECCNQNSD